MTCGMSRFSLPRVLGFRIMAKIPRTAEKNFFGSFPPEVRSTDLPITPAKTEIGNA